MQTTYTYTLSHADRRVGCRSVTRAHIIDWVRSSNFISWFTEYHAYAYHLVKRSIRAVAVLCQINSEIVWFPIWNNWDFKAGVTIHTCLCCYESKPDGDGCPVLARRRLSPSGAPTTWASRAISPDCECCGRLRERVSAEQSTFITRRDKKRGLPWT